MQGQTLSILGPNGSGKSTLLRAIAGLPFEIEGSLKVVPPPSRRGYLTQSFTLDRDLPASLFDLVRMGDRSRTWIPWAPASPRVQEALEVFQLQDIKNQPLGYCSGGQIQRALWARLWVQDPELLILDEPLNHLDTEGIDLAREVLTHWQKSKTLILSLHSPELAQALSDQVLQLQPVRWNPEATRATTLCVESP